MSDPSAHCTAPTQAVILARGLGTRMRREDGTTQLDAAQSEIAAQGVKAMIPIGRPFLDYALSALADAGFTRICLVIGPEHDMVRRYYRHDVALSRLEVQFAVQESPLGTSDAVLAAADVVGDDRFVVLNSDNYYPARALAALREAPGSALLGFERAALVREGNMEASRIEKYAVVAVGPDGGVDRIVEKPDAATLARFGQDAPISMNAWLFTPTIFEACRRVQPSSRGELELVDAVRLAIDELDEHFTVVPVSAGVLDLSSRGDIASVKAQLADVRVAL